MSILLLINHYYEHYFKKYVLIYHNRLIINSNIGMDYKILQVEINSGIGIVTINRPEAMNALNTAFFAEMDAFIASIRCNSELKVLIITGMGKAFVAGADIAELVNMDSVQGEAFSKIGQNTFNSISALEIPVIAAVNGYTLGGGCELAMSCDFRIASTHAKFGLPEVSLGLIPGYAGTQRLSRLTNLADALYMTLSGEVITAEDALRIGLVQKVTEPEHLMETVLLIAERIANKGNTAVKKAKSVIRKGFAMNFLDAAALEAKEFGALFGNGESGEGMRAFLEKRKPNW